MSYIDTYCSYLWCDINKSKLSKIRVTYNNIYRKILGHGRSDSASNMFVSNGIDTFEARLRLSCHRFTERVKNSKHEIVNCISSNSWIINNYALKHWESLVYIKRVTSRN